MIISETQPPPPAIWIDGYERGLDPWHADAMPGEFKSKFPAGERKAGWYALDWCGNVIGWYPDGMEIKDDGRNTG